MLKKLIVLLSIIVSVSTFAFQPNNMAYVEVNTNALSNVGCYLRASNKIPYFSMAAIFAGNINGDEPNSPIIYFNPQVKAVLASNQVQILQHQHIKVLMTLLGNHTNAGWSCMTDENSATQFADAIVKMVNQYHLDGVDIDDEYSTCLPNDTSLIMLAKAIKTNPGFKGKLLTKALFGDEAVFEANYQGHKLAEYLDYGWEMSYYDGGFDWRLAGYLKNGMTAGKLMIGGWTQMSYPSPEEIGNYTQQKQLAGAMVYDVKTDSQEYLGQLAQGEYHSENIVVMPNCLANTKNIRKF